MAKFCHRCGKQLSFRDSFVWDAKPICGACLRETDPTREKKPLEAVPPPEKLGFNWGAFFLPPLWLIFHGKVGAGIGLILLGWYLNYQTSRAGAVIVPFVIQLGIAIYVGKQGNKIAWKNKGYASLEQLKTKQKPWLVAGLVVWGIILVLFIIDLIIAYYKR